jgi:hypothetical protein
MKIGMKFCVAIALCASSSLFAGAKYGSAGCGLGSLVFGDQKGFVQVFAATTNATFYSQTFGITSGTSNCTDDGVAMIDKEKQYFSEANFESLKQEMAQGQGENLTAYASLFGCSSTAFATSMQGNYSKVFTPGVDADAMLQNVQSVVGSDATLQATCRDAN